MEQQFDVQPVPYPSVENKLEMAELLLKQNNLCFSLMLSRQMSHPQEFPSLDMSLLEGTVRSNHLLTYNLIMSYVSEEFNQRQIVDANERELPLPGIQNNEIRNHQENLPIFQQEPLEEIAGAEPLAQEQAIVQDIAQPLPVQEEEKDALQIQENELEQLQQQQIVEIESIEDEYFFYDFCDDYGLTKKEINKLPKYKWITLFSNETFPQELQHVKTKAIQKTHKTKKDLASTQETCCICLGKYRTNSQVRKLPCSHCFHVSCIDKWLRKTAKCPFCRKSIPGF